MSRKLKDAVLDALVHLPTTVSPGDRFTWVVLADRQSDMHGYAWPSYADIAARTGLNHDWVGHAVESLEAHGLLHVERRPGSTNRYRIVIPNPRGERGGIEHMTDAVSAGGPAVSAGVPRGERVRNQLENQLENLAPTALNFPTENQCVECDRPTTRHRWRCETCQSTIRDRRST